MSEIAHRLPNILLDWQAGALTEDEFLSSVEVLALSWEREHPVADQIDSLTKAHAREELLGRVLATIGSMRLSLVSVEDVPIILQVLRVLDDDPFGAALQWDNHWRGVDLSERSQRYRSHPFYIVEEA